MPQYLGVNKTVVRPIASLHPSEGSTAGKPVRVELAVVCKAVVQTVVSAIAGPDCPGSAAVCVCPERLQPRPLTAVHSLGLQ